MIYHIADYLVPLWGPFRLLKSHALLLAGGTFTAALLAWLLLPRLWDRLPRDRGKAICSDLGGMKSAGKPTGAGFWVSLIALPVILLFAPLKQWDLAAVGAAIEARDGRITAAYTDNLGWTEDALTIPGRV